MNKNISYRNDITHRWKDVTIIYLLKLRGFKFTHPMAPLLATTTTL